MPATQHDSLTTAKMIETLLQSDIEIQKSDQAFAVDGVQYEAGSYAWILQSPGGFGLGLQHLSGISE